MKSTTFSGLSLLFSSMAQAGVILPRQASYDFECDGQKYPKIEDCDPIYDNFNDPTTTWTAPVGGNTLFFDRGDEYDCRVEIVWHDPSYVVVSLQVSQGIGSIINTCLPHATGGYANDVGDRFSIGLVKNPTYDPPASEIAAAELTPLGKAKRADGDTEFKYGVHTTHGKPASMKHNIGNGLPGGSTWTWDESQSVTDHVGFSSEVSAGIEGVIGASLSTDISTDTTYTSGTSTTITISCEDNEYGQVYFQGYAEEWSGVLLPSGQQLVVTKPEVNSDGSTAGFYSYDCISK